MTDSGHLDTEPAGEHLLEARKYRRGETISIAENGLGIKPGTYKIVSARLKGFIQTLRIRPCAPK